MVVMQAPTDLWCNATAPNANCQRVPVRVTMCDNAPRTHAERPPRLACAHRSLSSRGPEMSKDRATIGADGVALPILPPARDARVWARMVRVVFYTPGFLALL